MGILCILFLYSGVFSSTIGSTVKAAAEPSLEETVRQLSAKMEEMEIDKLESKKWRNDLSAELQELKLSTANVGEELANAERRFQKVDNHLLMEILQLKPMLKVTVEKVRSVEEQVERERLKTHCLQVQMSELHSELHSVDIIRKNMTTMVDNLRLQLNDSLSNLTRNMRIFENSSLNFLKDCANSSYVSKLDENLKKLEKNAKNELGTLQSDLSPRLEKLEERCVHCDDVLEMKKTLTNHSSLLVRLNKHLREVESTCAVEPPSILNGKPLKFDRKPKSVVQYECDLDFVMTGNSTVLCEYGKWEGHPPICSLHTCDSEPPSIPNGKPLQFDRKPKSIVQYECDENFVLTGNSTVLCVHGRWEGYPPICSTCTGEPPSILNGKPLKFERKPKSIVQYECDPDFVMTGNSTVICEYGKWEGHPPICSLHTCDSEPPSMPNGKPLKFDRKPKSFVQYECDQEFVATGISTVLCESGKWKGHPPICSFFDATFTLVGNWTNIASITCYSDRYSQNIEFSRVVDTGTGGGLPMVSRQEGAVLSFSAAKQWAEISGAYECRFLVDNRSAGIVVVFHVKGGGINFPHRSQVANTGETVELMVHVGGYVNQSKLRWRHNGVLLSSWDGQKEVQISDVKPADAGIYECYEEGKRYAFHSLLRLIVRKCEKNRYGGNCEQECPVCYNGGICQDLLGVCICPAGFTGNNCEFACGENDVSRECASLCLRDDCKSKLFCKPDPYGCSCFPGFRESYCTEHCDPGWFGAECTQPCHCAGDCDRFTGACSGGCSPGWTGASCQIEDVK